MTRTLAIFTVLLLGLAACSTTPPREHEGRTAAPDSELILVAGASGRVGRYVIARLKQQGRAFRSLTRSRETAIERWGPAYRDMNWVEGDVRDAGRMREIMVGVTAVICVIGSSEISGPNSPEFVDYGGVVNLVDASRAEGLRHFVLLSAIGVTDPGHPFNRATKGALQWRFKGEEYLRASGLDYTIVRPAGLVNRPAGEQGLLIEQGDHWQPLLRSTLSRDDLAMVLIDVVDNSATRDTTFEIANDPTQPPGDWRAELASLRPDQG